MNKSDLRSIRKGVLDILLGEGLIRGPHTIDHIKPKHGSCCTCQVCGHYNSDGEDCVCSHNRLITAFSELFDSFEESEAVEEPVYAPLISEANRELD